MLQRLRFPGKKSGRTTSAGCSADFFFSYEGLRLWTPQGLQTYSVPDLCLRGVNTATNCTGTNTPAPAPLLPILNVFPLPNKGEDGLNDGLGIYQVGQSYPSSIDSISVRADHNFNDKFKVFGRYASTPSVSSTLSQAESVNSVINNRLVTLGATNLITSTQANELRFNITQVNSMFNLIPTNIGGATPFDVTTLPGPNGNSFPAIGSHFQGCLCFGGSPQFNIGESINAQRQYNITDTYSWTRGRHGLKFGVDWRRLATYSTPVLITEEVVFRSEAAVLANNVGTNGFVQANSESPSPVEPLYKNFSAFTQDEWRVTARLSLSLGLRWDVNPAPGNLTGPSPYTLNQITDLNTAQLAPVGTPLWKTDWHGFAPRVGGAYQLGQTPGRETVLRAGVGVFYDLGNATGSAGFGGVGFFSSASFTNVSFPLTSAQLALPAPSTAPPYDGNVNAFDPNLKLPYTLQWNLAIEQGLGSKQALTLSYVGSAARRLLETYYVSPASNPNFGTDSYPYITKNGPTSDYDALQVQFQRTLSHGLQALASYTYSHSIDNASSNFELQDLLERASSDFDIRHNFQAALTYDVPGEYSNPVLSGLLKRWAFDARITARSALPVDILGNNYTDPATLQEVYYHPNLVPGQPLYLYGSQYPGGKIINYNAFSVPTSGPGYDSEGDTPRNYARGGGAWQLNFAVRREFPIYERLRLQFRAEAFNLFNHPSFAGVNGYWQSGPWNPQYLYGFGGATSTLNNGLGGLNALYQTGGPRSLQLALKLIF
jgi:TonB dependent receptor